MSNLKFTINGITNSIGVDFLENEDQALEFTLNGSAGTNASISGSSQYYSPTIVNGELVMNISSSTPTSSINLGSIVGPPGVAGPAGPRGEDGRGFTILDRFNTLSELEAEGVKEIGNAYLVGGLIDPIGYVWNGEQWINVGGIKGPRGEKGETGATGETGEQGIQGVRGPQGFYFTPTLAPDGLLSWTNNGDLPNPPSINIKGQTGEKGETGAKGETGHGLKILGTYATLSALNAAVPSPNIGDFYNVGTAPPYTIYLWDGVSGQWEDQGQLEGPPGEKGETGADGIQGPPGLNGSDGATFTPFVNSEGVLSWTNNKGLPNPASVNIKGEKGEKGDTGADGATGATGATFTPSVSSAGVITWTNNGGLPNPVAVSIKGDKGDTGEKGDQGLQGLQGIPGPNILSTSTLSNITGLIMGNGSSIVAAVSGVDYVAPVNGLIPQNMMYSPINNWPNNDIPFLTTEMGGNLIIINSAAARTIGVPADSNVNHPIGAEFEFYKRGTGSVTFVPESGVTIHSVGDSKVMGATGTGATIKKIAANTWWLVGGLA